jgi:hypothetical protein
MERKPGVAGGSKWTYEATFHIAMKGGREYYTTAAGMAYKYDERLVDTPKSSF